MRAQATKASRPQVELHIERQRRLGERMIGDHDRPRIRELLFTAAVIALVCWMKSN